MPQVKEPIEHHIQVNLGWSLEDFTKWFMHIGQFILYEDKNPLFAIHQLILKFKETQKLRKKDG